MRPLARQHCACAGLLVLFCLDVLSSTVRTSLGRGKRATHTPRSLSCRGAKCSVFEMTYSVSNRHVRIDKSKLKHTKAERTSQRQRRSLLNWYHTRRQRLLVAQDAFDFDVRSTGEISAILSDYYSTENCGLAKVKDSLALSRPSFEGSLEIKEKSLIREPQPESEPESKHDFSGRLQPYLYSHTQSKMTETGSSGANRKAFDPIVAIFSDNKQDSQHHVTDRYIFSYSSLQHQRFMDQPSLQKNSNIGTKRREPFSCLCECESLKNQENRTKKDCGPWESRKTENARETLDKSKKVYKKFRTESQTPRQWRITPHPYLGKQGENVGKGNWAHEPMKRVNKRRITASSARLGILFPKGSPRRSLSLSDIEDGVDFRTLFCKVTVKTVRRYTRCICYFSREGVHNDLDNGCSDKFTEGIIGALSDGGNMYENNMSLHSPSFRPSFCPYRMHSNELEDSLKKLRACSCSEQHERNVSRDRCNIKVKGKLYSCKYCNTRQDMGNRYTICNCVELIRTNGRFEYNYYKNSKIQGSDDYYTEKDIQSKKTQQETNSDLFISLPSLAEICQRLDLDSVVTSTRSRGQWRESLSQARLSARCSHVAFRRGNQRATRGYRFSPLPKGQAWGLWEISARAARVSASSRARTPLKGASSRQMEGIFSQLTPNLQDKWWRDHRDSRDKESSAGAVKDKRAFGVGPRSKSYGLCTNRKRKPVLFSIVYEHRNDIAAPPIWFKYMKQSRVCSEGSSDKLITENKPRECELNTLVHHYRNGSAFSRIWAMDREISIVSSNVSNTSPVTNKSSHCRSKDLVRHLPNDPLLPLILFKDEKNNPTNIVQTSTTVPTQNMTLSRESSLTARQYPNSFYGASLSHKTKRKNSIKYESLGERLRFLHQTRASPFVLNDMKPAHSGNIEQVRGISIYTNETGGEEKMSYPHDERKDYPSNNPEKSVYHKSENVMSEKSMFVADPLNIDTSEIVDDDLLKRSPGSTDSEQTFDYATIGPPRRRLLSLEENHAEDTPDCRTLNSQQDTVQNSLSGEGSKLQTYATAEDQIHQGQFDFKPEGNEQTASARNEQDTKAKEQTRQKRRPTSKKASSCTTTEKSERKHHVLSRHPRHVHYVTQDAEDDGVRLKAAKAVYLSGAEVLRFIPRDPSKRYALPNVNFTVELWAKPEGGQHLPVTIVGMADVCQGSVSGGVWSVRLTSQSVNGRTDIRYSFSLSTEASSTLADATGPTGYTPGHWTHIAAVYDGTRMKLYVDGAQVAVNLGRRGKVFPVPLAHCKELQIGGSVSSKNRFRGTLSDLRVWKDVLSQEEIVNSQKYPQRRPRPAKESFVIEDFLNLDEWELIRGHAVRKVALYRSSRITQGHHHHHPIPVPPCGETVCDNPEVVKHYVDHEPLRNFKVVRYRIVNLMNDDGASPIVSNGQILRQHTALNAAFRRYNIGFHLDVTSIRNTLLRQKLVMFGCAASLVGNGVCDIECNQTRTGNDGGDCDMYHVTCNASNVGNGVCDFECNKAYHGWDGGDCCLPGEKAHYTCYDPRSPHRGYLSIEELKDVVQLPSVDHLHVMFASWNTDHLIGIATFPWDKHVFGVRGGTVVQPQTFGVSGQTDSLVHEIGHNLGLWHVHHGVSELPCGDPCTEVEASMEHGDLCSDTAPTPQNVHCRDPGVAPDVCDRYRLYTDTPFSNFMSYADDNCTQFFTPQQEARMHCYLDLVYLPWRNGGQLAPVPLPPKVTASDRDSVTLAWISPLGPSMKGSRPECAHCLPHGVMTQYAVNATSKGQSAPEADGPPDAEPCSLSPKAWSPTRKNCDTSSCVLELSLQWPVPAERVYVWITKSPVPTIKSLTLEFQDGMPLTYKNVPVSCDVPLTLTPMSNQTLNKVILRVSHSETAVDAIQVDSLPGNRRCAMCQPIRYRLHRVPAFRKGRVVRTNITMYTDRDMEKGMSYSYWLEAVADRKISQASPTLHYTFGQPFCGNGQIDRELGELCDDGNLRGGDGCDLKCKTEELFKCKGEPSLCYVFYGDGLCEDFEKESNVIDCGYHTPEGFVDQWAHEAEANPAFQLPECPARAAVGQPAPEDNCLSVRDPRRAWYPCGHSNQPEIYWLEVYIPRPVIVTEVILHLGSDGRNQTDMAPKNMSVDLILTDGTSFRLTPRDITLECKPDGFSFPVKHDLSTPFFKSKGVRLQFTSFNISIAGVRLRSSKSLDPITLTSCGEGHLYSPRAAVCVPAQCTNLTCGHYSAPHAHVKCTGFTDGHVCSLVCHDGYSFMWPSAMEVTCVRGQWMTSQDNICVPVPCGRLSLAYAKVTCNTSQPVFGDICTFRCRHPAKLQGVDNKVRCESDGLWSSPDSKCVVRCDPPLRMPGARLLTRSCRKGQQLVDTQCRIRCRKGYRVEGASAKRRRLSAVTCSSSSRWSGRGCVAVTCPHLDPIYKGLVTCSKGRQVYSTCRLRCPGETRTQSVTCKPSGKWSSRLTPCTSFRSTRCPKLKSRVVEASLTVRCRGYVVGTKCPCHCPTPDEEAVIFKKKANVRSMSTDTSGASRDVVINHVTCTGAGHWFPNPVDLKCVQSCNRNTVSDGWCDARNNRRRCQYDGGDCCQSTLGGPVQAPNSCVNACSCKDPRAKENRGKIRDVTGGGSARSVDEGEGWGYGRQ